MPQITTGGTANVKTNGGLTTITFEPKAGTVRVHLPDDMRAGDTISGTVVSEPKGQTPEERAKNGSELKGLTVEIDGKMVEFFTEPFSAPPVKEQRKLNQPATRSITATKTELSPLRRHPLSVRCLLQSQGAIQGFGSGS